MMFITEQDCICAYSFDSVKLSVEYEAKMLTALFLFDFAPFLFHRNLFSRKNL